MLKKSMTCLNANGLSVTKYHAGLSAEERKENQDSFIYDIKPVVVATNAFGMGIDKSNVRFVIHYNDAAVYRELLSGGLDVRRDG